MPDPTPALWYNQSTIASATVGQPLFLWPDSGIFGRDAEIDPNQSFPLLALADSKGAGPQFPRSAILTITNQEDFVDPFSVFAVLLLPSLNLGSGYALVLPNGGNANLAPLAVANLSVLLRGSTGVFGFSTPANTDQILLVAVRFANGQATFYRNGILLGTVAPGAINAFHPVTLAALSSPQGTNAGPIVLEIQAYDQALSDAGFASIQTALVASWL